MPNLNPLRSKFQLFRNAIVDVAFSDEIANESLFYLARVIESGEAAINSFQEILGYRPPDGTVRAKIPNLHYTMEEEQCPLFYPLLPPEFVMTPVKDQVILVMFPTLGTSGDVGGNGYWLREAVRGEPVEITGEAAPTAKFDFETVGTQVMNFGDELTEDTKSSGNYEGDNVDYHDSA